VFLIFCPFSQQLAHKNGLIINEPYFDTRSQAQHVNKGYHLFIHLRLRQLNMVQHSSSTEKKSLAKHSIEKQFVVISPDKKVSIEQADQSLYSRLDDNYNQFAGHELVSCFEFSENWSSWEIHPNGDEVVLLMSGKVEFIIDLPDGLKSVELVDVGDYAIVPKNTWHTAKTSIPTKVLFITPGEGTAHKSD
jgi:mannose-6-phosphate isomerase-like protein (cupin superfamily)